ncbi:MlaD family protein [Nocardia sp. NPDC059246]|uniref:MlaD family protein n=1 Tax=unclassified Nocardia TaxID=2637762 RepID=UPI0036AD4B15
MQRALRNSAGVTGPLAIVRRIGHNEMLLGAVVVLVAVVALAATSVLYLHPLNRKTIAFETTDASSLSTGEEVRVAGITVGKVTKVSIQPSTVRVEAEVSADTFIGSDSRVQVRMLTPVGGYAVTVVPLGTAALGDTVIPVDRVVVPYSIGDVLQAAPQVTDKVDGGTIDANIDQVAQALQHNPESIGSMISGMNSIATVLDQQREQVRAITDLAAEYLQTFNGSRDFVYELIRQIEIVLSTYNTWHAGFNEAYHLLGDTLDRIQPLLKFYLNHKEEVLSAVTNIRSAIEGFQQNMGPAIDQLQGLRDRLVAWLGPDGLATVSGGAISAAALCVPVPGRTC